MFGGLAQGKQQMKQNVQLAEKQSRDMMRQQAMNNRMQEKSIKEENKLVDKAIKNGTPVNLNLQPQQTTYSITLKRKTKTYSIFSPVAKGIRKVANSKTMDNVVNRLKQSKTVNNARDFGRDLIEIGKERGSGQKMANMMASGAIMAGTGYLTDKIIQADRKKLGAPVDTPEKEKKSLGKKIKNGVLIGAGTLGATAGTLMLARKGKLNRATMNSAWGKAKTMGKEAFKDAAGSPVKAAVAVGLGAAFPAVGYISQRQQLKDQIKQSQSEERQYATPAEKTPWYENWGFYMGKTSRGKLADQMTKPGRGVWMNKAAKVVRKTGPVGILAGVGLAAAKWKPFDWGEKAVRKPLEAVDKKAFAYEKSQNQPVQQ
jgi:hypothetical protein